MHVQRLFRGGVIKKHGFLIELNKIKLKYKTKIYAEFSKNNSLFNMQYQKKNNYLLIDHTGLIKEQ